MTTNVKIPSLNLSKYLGFILLTLFLATSCDKEDTNEEPSSNTGNNNNTDTGDKVDIKYGIATVSGAWPNTTTYIQGTENLDFSSISNDSARELTGTARVINYGKNLYALPFGAPANLVKYNFDDKGVPQQEEKIVAPGSNTFSTVHFESETVAYATLAGGISKLIKFNPTTMRIEDEISLKVITDKFPEATRTYYLDMVERDNKLFMGVYYEKNFKPVSEYAHVAIINLDTKTVEKVIEDQRTGMVFGGQSSNAGMIKMPNGDIYVQAKGTRNVGGNAPSGLLRIKNGETEFDTNYFFDLDTATGKICIGIYNVNNRFFTARVEDETDFWEFNGNPQFKYYEIDVDAKTSKGAVPGLPTTYGSRTMNITLIEGDIAVTISTNDENAVYKLGEGAPVKLFSSTGGYITGFNVLE